MLVLVVTSGFGLNKLLVITLEAWTIVVLIFQNAQYASPNIKTSRVIHTDVASYASTVSVTRNNAFINCMLLHSPAIHPIEIRYFADFHLLSVYISSGSRLGHKCYMSPDDAVISTMQFSCHCDVTCGISFNTDTV